MLGIDLYEELKRDYTLFGMDRVKGPGYRAERFKEADITDKSAVNALIKKIKPDIIIHTAAFTDVDGCEFDKKKAFRINSDGAKNVALAAKSSGASFIYISTDFVFDGKKKRAYKESDRCAPLSAYGASKLKGEESVRKILKRYFILRTSWLYGRNGKNFPDTIIVKAKTESALKVVNDQVGSPTYTKDLSKAIHVLIDKVLTESRKPKAESYGTYHVSNSGSTSWYKYAKKILAMAGSKTKVIPISSKELNRPARRPAMSVLDNYKFRIFTGYRMRRWEGALGEYIKKG